ncbi:glutamate-5-semialdehyde dehydrogenase [Gallibacter intestinalis]|uniref:Gamma-glutamyl phosphate reductase n=1 Tax=Gallibacter intestinalis TaxID=2779356 RepID=A0ABR9QWD2_9FIRM|nr:glutamate-5-semialdehyde dehydrogenase [Gallibacter intestinalis]MBE5035180.1 glutamate-5-semialdehyde dehydrogenase [Gallibacter intestinalis]
MDYVKQAQLAKKDSAWLSALDTKARNSALMKIAEALESSKDVIFKANKEDLDNAVKAKIPAPILARLKFDESKLSSCVQGIRDLIGLEDPLNKILLKRQLDEGLVLTKITCAIGVIGVIFESRPDALVQISSLCVKSGNCAILKGGSEAAHTNRILFDTIHHAGVEAGLPEHFLTLVEDRAGIAELLGCHDYIDLIIPRGSNEFVQYIMANSKIPVMGHADGICHIYVAEDADIDMALKIIEDSKTQYAAACNAVETLLVNEQIYDNLVSRITDKIELREGDFNKEYLDWIMTVKKVSGLQEAIESINANGSHHTDCIITTDAAKADEFMRYVDSAGVYWNCSTRFADGFRYGFGAEVGISTGKLHARGPVGLDGLVTYKYKLAGNGQIVGDYASGKKSFHFKDID